MPSSWSINIVRTIDRVARALHVEVEGVEKIPAKGPAILVTNHAFGFDAALLMSRIEALTGRRVWVLGEHAWWKVPGLSQLAAAAGTVDGTQENADRLLSNNELVLVLPGGLREAMKPRDLRYRLLWGRRYGFVRAALRNRAPIVPIASIGPEDVFDLVGDPFQRSRRLHLPFPLPRPAHWLPIPHLAALAYVVSDAVPMPMISFSSSESEDAREQAIRRIRREVEGALHEIFEERLTSRLGFAVRRHD